MIKTLIEGDKILYDNFTGKQEQSVNKQRQKQNERARASWRKKICAQVYR